MFWKQLSFIAQEEALKELYGFAIQAYIEAWFTALEAIEAPSRDLVLLNPFFNFPTNQFLIPHSKNF